MFTSISQNLFVPHSSHWSRKFSGRLQLSRSFYQHKLNLGVFIVNSYCWSYLILPPSYSVPGVKTWDFVAKGALKKKKQFCKSCRSVDHFSFIFCVSYNSIVHEIVSPVVNSARFPTSCLQIDKVENLNFTWSALQEMVMGCPTWIGLLRLASTTEMMIITYNTEDSNKGILVPLTNTSVFCTLLEPAEGSQSLRNIVCNTFGFLIVENMEDPA